MDGMFGNIWYAIKSDFTKEQYDVELEMYETSYFEMIKYYFQEKTFPIPFRVIFFFIIFPIYTVRREFSTYKRWRLRKKMPELFL